MGELEILRLEKGKFHFTELDIEQMPDSMIKVSIKDYAASIQEIPSFWARIRNRNEVG